MIKRIIFESLMSLMRLCPWISSLRVIKLLIINQCVSRHSPGLGSSWLFMTKLRVITRLHEYAEDDMSGSMHGDGWNVYWISRMLPDKINALFPLPTVPQATIRWPVCLPVTVYRVCATRNVVHDLNITKCALFSGRDKDWIRTSMSRLMCNVSYAKRRLANSSSVHTDAAYSVQTC